MTVTEKMSRERVYGFLSAKNGKMINGRGEEILLCGMGLGNWLLPEGYMWRFSGEYDRPRRIESLVGALCGEEYCGTFWHAFRERYITEADVRAMAEHGFNSVRLPVNWRIVMEECSGIVWREEGFVLIDRFLDWCEKYRLYVCLDLHGAPGGQTGHNIDDSLDDVPHLLTDGRDSEWYRKTIALWCEFAARYRDRSIIAMYDLLNEPYRTEKEGTPVLPDLRENLKQFYRDCIRAIREIDPIHMVSVESHYWASRADFFTEKFDDNMCAHFHRYWCPPAYFMYKEFLDKREELDMTLYLGETGENSAEWFAAMYPLAAELDIGYNIWPWKKMDTDSSPYSIRPPKGWEKIQAYTKDPRIDTKPSPEEARVIFDEYLENIDIEKCTYIENVIPSIFRRPGCTVKACDFDTRTEPYHGVRFLDDNGNESDDWNKIRVLFSAGSIVTYKLYANGEAGAAVIESDFDHAAVKISVDGIVAADFVLDGTHRLEIPIESGRDSRLTVECTSGKFVLDRIKWSKV